jgi:hypothetical protein
LENANNRTQVLRPREQRVLIKLVCFSLSAERGRSIIMDDDPPKRSRFDPNSDNVLEYKRRIKYLRTQVNLRRTAETSFRMPVSLPADEVVKPEEKKEIRSGISLDEAKVILLSRMQEIRDSQAKDAAETPVPATKEFRTRQNDEAGGFSKKGERSFTIDQARKVLHTINDPSGSSVANGGLGAVSGNLDEGGIAFAKHNEERLRTMVHLLMSLDQTTIWSMRREFKKRNWRLSMYEFILVASSFMKSQDIVHLDALCEMFKEIDVQVQTPHVHGSASLKRFWLC